MNDVIRENPLDSACALWHFGNTIGEACYPYDLEVYGNVRCYAFDDDQNAESKRHFGDGCGAEMNGGYMSMDATRMRKLRPDGHGTTLYLRVWLPENGHGGLFFSDFLGFTIHGTGIATVFVGTEIPTGCNFREMPLAKIPVGGWMDLIVTVGGGELCFYCNGKRYARLPFPYQVKSAFDERMVLGGFFCNKPDTYGTSRVIDTADGCIIDTFALWKRNITADEAASLMAVPMVTESEETALSKACRVYNALFDASVEKDTVLCDRLFSELRAQGLKDEKRPRYHLTQPFGFIFDPCGAFYHEGLYHVFSYHNVNYLLEYSSLDHYISKDLIHWTAYPIGPFADSDCDVSCIYLLNHFYDEDGNLRVLFTGQGKEGKCGILARTDDGMKSYTDKKIAIYPYHHDGHVFRHDGVWYTITSKLSRGRRPGEAGDPVMLWSSHDLEHWTEESEIFCQRKTPRNSDGFMEFPYLLRYGEKDVMILGGHPVRYWVGRFDWTAKKFIPDTVEGQLLDITNHFHCFNPLCVDHKGENGAERRIIQAMYMDPRNEAKNQMPWYGIHVLPRELTLAGDHLCQNVLPEAASLRKNTRHMDVGHLSAEDRKLWDGVGTCVEIEAEFSPDSQGEFGVEVYCSADHTRTVRVTYRSETGEFGLTGCARQCNFARAYQKVGEPVRMRVFLDRGVIEAFMNGQTCTTAAYDEDAQNGSVGVFCNVGEAECISFAVHDLELSY